MHYDANQSGSVAFNTGHFNAQVTFKLKGKYQSIVNVVSVSAFFVRYFWVMV